MKQFQQKLFFIVIVVGFFLSEITYCQQPLTRKISFLEGLYSDVVYDLMVDKQGLLFLGTDEGLMTYNGVHFEKLETPESLGNSINSIQQDENGTVWCKNFANQLFYVKNNQLLTDKNVNNLLNRTNSNLIDYFVGTKCIYIITQKVIYKYTNGLITEVYDVKKNNSENFTAIVYDYKNQKLHITSNLSLYSFRNEILLTKKSINSEQKVLEIFKGKLAYCTKALGYNCIVGNRDIELEKDNLHKTYLNRLSATEDNLWLCTNKGVYEYDEERNIFKNGILKGSRITDVVKDLEGNHWISTLDAGIYLLPYRKLFELEVPTEKKRSFTRISKGPNANYFVGTNDGSIFEITENGKTVQEYKTDWDNTIEFINFVGDTILTNYGFFKIGNPTIFSNKVYFGKNLKEDGKGNLLIASSFYGGLLSKKFKGIPNFNNESRKFRIIEHGQSEIKILVFKDKRAKSVLYSPLKQEYYYGFIDGLFVYDAKGNEQEIKSENKESIIAAYMVANADGSIWVASYQRGVFLIKNKKVVKQFSTKNGLSNNNCKLIAKSEEGLWIITETGFDYYDFKSNKVKSAELNLCMKGITINDIAILKDVIALATNQGVYYFNKNILANETLPKFNFTDFLVNNKKIDNTKEIELKHNENNVNIKFNTVHYRSLGNYTYKYRLKGLDDKWFIQSSNAKNINYLALNPGDYTFQIKIKIGANYTPIQEINFKIYEPFWLQLWFLSIVILALGALMYTVYGWAVVKTRKGQVLKEQLALSQLTALRSQMNPHFIFNVLNAVQGLIYSNQKSKASDYLGKFSDLMRRILDTSDLNEVTIEKEFETIGLYVSLERARFEDDFEYHISFPDGVDLNDYIIPSMIIQPFVENAIKHGLMHKEGQKRLEIKVELLENVWCFTIDDNGIGRKASEIINQKIKKHISFATKAIDNRIDLISKTSNIAIDIEVIDKRTAEDESLGTRIKIYIPKLE